MELRLLESGLLSWAQSAQLSSTFLEACESSDRDESFAEALAHYCSKPILGIQRARRIGTELQRFALDVDPRSLPSDSLWRNPSIAYRAMEEVLDSMRRIPHIVGDQVRLGGLLKNLAVLAPSERRWQLGVLALQAATAARDAGFHDAAYHLLITFISEIRGLLKDNLLVHAFLIQAQLCPAKAAEAAIAIEPLLLELSAKQITLPTVRDTLRALPTHDDLVATVRELHGSDELLQTLTALLDVEPRGDAKEFLKRVFIKPKILAFIAFKARQMVCPSAGTNSA